MGAAAAQPDRAAAQGTAAVHPRRDGHLGALPAARRRAAPRRARGAAELDQRAPAGDVRARAGIAPRDRAAPDGRGVLARRRPGRGRGRRRSRTAATAVARIPSAERRPCVGLRAARPARGAGGGRRSPRSSGRFLRGDAVEVLEASRRPGAAAVRRWPAPAGAAAATSSTSRCRRSAGSRRTWSREQLRRLAGARARGRRSSRCRRPTDADDGLGWRTRMQYVGCPAAGRGLRKHRSHEVVAGGPLPDRRPPGRTRGHRAATTLRTGERLGARHARRRPSSSTCSARDLRRSTADGFWQVHPEAPRVLVEAVLDLLAPAAGGAGPGPVRRRRAVLGVPGRRRGPGRARARASRPTGAAVRARRRRTSPTCRRPPVRAGRVDRVLAARVRVDRGVDVVVLDPPRDGRQARRWSTAIAALRPRAVAYVACDPAALARDVALLRRARLRLADAARLRPVPDDAPRRVRRFADENRL